MLLFIVHSTAKVISALIHIHIIAHDDSEMHRRCHSGEKERRHRVLLPYSCPISSNLEQTTQASLHPRSRPRCYLVFDDAGLGVTSGNRSIALGNERGTFRSKGTHVTPRPPRRPVFVVRSPVEKHMKIQQWPQPRHLCNQPILCLSFILLSTQMF